MLIHDVAPQQSCIMGGSKIYIALHDVSNSEDLMAVFQVFLNGCHQSHLDRYLNQPRKDSGSETWFSFYSPPQPNFDNIPEEAQIKLTVQVGTSLQQTLEVGLNS